MIKTIKITEATCDLCSNVWRPRGDKLPKNCPECGSPRWNNGRKRPPIAEQIAAAKEAKAEAK